jgi:hypothetical protein
MSNPAGRPRKPVDQARLDVAYEAWKAGRLSLSEAARIARCSRDMLRLRWPEFAAWAEAKRQEARERYYARYWATTE